MRLVQVGVITAAHGIRGHVKIRSFTENPESLLSCHPLTDATGNRPFKITRQGIKDSILIVSIEGIHDRNAAELLKGTALYALAPSSQEAEENKWPYDTLIGLEARGIDGTVYGKVIGVYNFGAGDIIEISLANGKTEMLPFKNAFVGDINVENGTLIVFPPDYAEANEEP